MTLQSAPRLTSEADPARRSASSDRQLVWALRGVALLLAAAGAAAGMLNESMNSDGVSYLDIGDAYFRGDWWTAVNATWSPLYAVILGAVMKLVRPGMLAEFAVVHAVNFVIFVAALFSFEFFWRAAGERYHEAAPGEAERPARLPGWAFVTIGYALFIWSSTALIPVYAVTPDMLVAASVYIAAGLLLRTASPDASWRTHAGLGAALGVGYLAKAAMFPLAFVFVAVCALQAMLAGRSPARVVPAIAAFFIVGAPFIAVLSVKEGHLTFSDVGSFTYLKHVYEVPVPHYEPGIVPVQGEPLHPLTKIETTPAVYAFAEPVGGTYPLSYDPAYWYEGLDAPFNARLQFRAFAVNMQYYFELFFRLQGPFLGIVVLLLLAAGTVGRRPMWPGGWTLVLIAAAALGMYSLIYVTGRYIGAFVVLLWAGLLMSVRLRPDPAHGVWLRRAGAALVFLLAVNIGTFHLDGLNAMLGVVPSSPGMVSGTPPPAARPTVVARHLTDLGLQPGDEIGVIGYSFDAFWARLARLRIVAEISPAQVGAFWAAGEVQRREVERVFAGLGVRAIVAEQVPGHVYPAGWTRLGNTSYYALLLP